MLKQNLESGAIRSDPHGRGLAMSGHCHGHCHGHGHAMAMAMAVAMAIAAPMVVVMATAMALAMALALAIAMAMAMAIAMVMAMALAMAICVCEKPQFVLLLGCRVWSLRHKQNRLPQGISNTAFRLVCWKDTSY